MTFNDIVLDLLNVVFLALFVKWIQKRGEIMIEKNNNAEKDRILVTHGSGVYDVTTFASIHPGGPKSGLTFCHIL